MKKIATLATATVLFSSIVAPALAVTEAVSEQFGLGYGTYLGLGTADLKTGVMMIVQYMLGFLGIIAVLIILYGGFTWMTAAGNDEKVGKAKQIISAGVIGLVIIFVSYALVYFVITQIGKATGASGF
ncbi:MAG: hypothetical protein WCX71_02305 [Candidatus Buchananbacteria bacterium]